MGEEIQYFNGTINYWKSQPKELEKEPKLEITNPKQEIPKTEDATIKENTKTQEFQWNKYLDPKNTEFFREGDYTPPEPFMELVRNPSDQNIRMWFAYMDRKNELAGRLSKRITMQQFQRQQKKKLSRRRTRYRLQLMTLRGLDFACTLTPSVLIASGCLKP